VKRLFFLALIVIVLAIFGVYIWQHFQDDQPRVEGIFKVGEGEMIGDIARNLKKGGYITSRVHFYITNLIFMRGDHPAEGGYLLSSEMSMKEIANTLGRQPWAKYVTIPPNTSKEQIGRLIGSVLGWKELDMQFFPHTLAGMQWQRYHEEIQRQFVSRYSWSRAEMETFLTLSSLYHEDDFDFFKHAYEPGTYEIPSSVSRAQAAGAIIEQFTAEHGEDEQQVMLKRLDRSAMDKVAKLMKEEMELMPDIVALPPADVSLIEEGGKKYLRFSTMYWNKGRGPLELVADPKSKGIIRDIDRKVFQRIYRLDGDYRERLSGTFLWHNHHLHYHFTDFAIYTLEPVEVAGVATGTISQKATFCIRDSEPIDLAHPGADRRPSYTICGKERQGISPGWADSYYYTYADQKFNISNLAKGVYKLTITVNPKNRFEEISRDNNVAESLVYLNVEDEFVEVLEEKHSK